MGDILIETQRIGAIVRVVAIDADSGTEVSFQAPATSSPMALQRLAASKIRYVVAKKDGRL
jgi:hypothetical protein